MKLIRNVAVAVCLGMLAIPTALVAAEDPAAMERIAERLRDPNDPRRAEIFAD